MKINIPSIRPEIEINKNTLAISRFSCDIRINLYQNKIIHKNIESLFHV